MNLLFAVCLITSCVFNCVKAADTLEIDVRVFPDEAMGAKTPAEVAADILASYASYDLGATVVSVEVLESTQTSAAATGTGTATTGAGGTTTTAAGVGNTETDAVSGASALVRPLALLVGVLFLRTGYPGPYVQAFLHAILLGIAIELVLPKNGANAAQPSGFTRQYDNCRLIDEVIDYRLYWNLKTGSNELEVGLSGEIAGWAALGVSEDGTMHSSGLGAGSDIALGFVEGDGTTGHINDYWTKQRNLPVKDADNNIATVTTVRDGTQLLLEYTRPITSTDSTHDRNIVTSGTQWMIYAANLDAPPASTSAFNRHTGAHMGGFEIDWTKASQCSTGADEERVVRITIESTLGQFNEPLFVQKLATALSVSEARLSVEKIVEFREPFCPECRVKEFTMPNYHLPVKDTTYACMTFAVNEASPVDIIRLEIIKDNTNVLHHVLAFWTSFEPSADQLTTPLDKCNMPPGSSPFWGWAPGSMPFDLPSDAGFRVGGAGNLNWVTLQYHYDMPVPRDDQYDSSGFRIFLSPTLRAKETGMILMGIKNSEIYVPGGETKWHMAGGGVYPPTATPTSVYAWLPHMHKAGKEAWLRVEHADMSTDTILSDLNYDFNAQTIRHLDPKLELNPNDKLVFNCVYSSVQAGVTNPAEYIQGGDETDNEMCLAGLFFTPKDVGASLNKMKVRETTTECVCDFADTSGTGDCTGVSGCDGSPPQFTSCMAAADCATCNALGPPCGWCATNRAQLCLSNTLQAKCETPSIEGVFDSSSCAHVAAKSQCYVHTDCAACDAATGCSWCLTGTGDGSGYCMTDNADAVCAQFNALLVSPCPVI